MARSFSLRTKILSLSLKAAGFRFLKPVFVFLFNHTGNFMSAKNLYEGTYWRAFYHPKALYPLHILILPKRGIVSLAEAPNNSGELYSDLFALVKKLIVKFNLEGCGYRLITNGGPNQTVPQWHWHLISERFGETSD
jgi:histidine triad (HIT) family protein